MKESNEKQFVSLNQDRLTFHSVPSRNTSGFSLNKRTKLIVLPKSQVPWLRRVLYLTPQFLMWPW